MGIDVSVLVPYRPDGGHRDRAWAWNKRRWRKLDVELVEQVAPDGTTPAEFNHPYAINRAAERATHDVFIVADADTSFDPEWVGAAVRHVRTNPGSWVLPRFYDQLTEESSARILARDPAASMGNYEVVWRGDSVSWSGLVVVPRDAFKLVGGYDERWRFWGGDDVAFASALTCLYGPVTRLPGRAIHLWHPRTHLDAQPKDQHDLMHRYIRAADDPAEMRALLAEREQ